MESGLRNTKSRFGYRCIACRDGKDTPKGKCACCLYLKSRKTGRALKNYKIRDKIMGYDGYGVNLD